MRDTIVRKNLALTQEDITKIHTYRNTLFQQAGEEWKAYQQLFIDVNQQIRKHKTSFAVPIKRSIVGLYTCEVVINTQTFRFLLDTGAQISGMLSSGIQALQLVSLKRNIQMGSVGGAQQATQLFLCDKLTIGDMDVLKQPLLELDHKHFSLPYLNVSIMNFDGILGWDILRHLDFEIDDKNRMFRILDDDITFPYKNFLSLSFPVVIVQDGQNNVQAFGFDSGAKDTWVAKNYIQNSDAKIIRNVEALGMGVLGVERLAMQQINEVTLYLHYAKLVFRELFSGRVDMLKNISLCGVLGNRMFRNRSIQVYNSKSFMRIL
ncbi:MAG: retropepsin-like aspartic protease [Breznakia sp.]